MIPSERPCAEHDWRFAFEREKDGEKQDGVICWQCIYACFLGRDGEPTKAPVPVSSIEQWHWWHDMLDGYSFRPWPDDYNSGPLGSVEEVEALFLGSGDED